MRGPTSRHRGEASGSRGGGRLPWREVGEERTVFFEGEGRMGEKRRSRMFGGRN